MAQRCSFCGEDRRAVDRLIAGHGGVAICADCARLAVELSAAPDEEVAGDLLLTSIGSLVTNDPRHGGMLGVIEGAALALRNGRVIWLGRHRALPDRYREFREVECHGRMVAPAFVDAHRHLEARSDGDLVTATDQVTAAVGTSLEQGATTLELRSWGASGPEAEVTMLSAVQAAAETLPADLVSTFVVGTDPPARNGGYVGMVESVLLPTVASIATYLDLVVGGPLDHHSALRVAEIGRRYGLRPRVHVDSEEALSVALDSRAVSVDGMWGMDGAADAVAEAGLVMVGLPAASWIGGRKDPTRSMWEAGVTVALGTGCADGVVPTMPMAMAVAVHHLGLSPGQALWSATRGGALALEEPDKGRVALGSTADLVLLEAETPTDLVVEPGRDPVVRVIKDGVPL
jgi:imidazolonepropionase